MAERQESRIGQSDRDSLEARRAEPGWDKFTLFGKMRPWSLEPHKIGQRQIVVDLYGLRRIAKESGLDPEGVSSSGRNVSE